MLHLNRSCSRLFAPACAMSLVLLLACRSGAAQTPLETNFSYQGSLSNGSGPISGMTDLRFRLYALPTGGAAINGLEVSLPATTVTAGVFSVTLDFGAGVFAGDARWLEIDVRNPAGSGTYTTLAPRQPTTAVPYALFALSGNSGPAGPTGPQGPQGYTGPQGPLGQQGLTGPAGATGPQGAAGPQGAIGPQGATGQAGPTGQQGPAGPQGATGSTGPRGLDGPQGSQGLPGSIGATGPQGPIGFTGIAGPIGLTGPTGLTGPIGPMGPQGDRGTPGDSYWTQQGSSIIYNTGGQVVIGPALGAPGLLAVTSVSGADGIAASSGSGFAINAISISGTAVRGLSDTSFGVSGSTNAVNLSLSAGVGGFGNRLGVLGIASAADSGQGVTGTANGTNGIGVFGNGGTGIGVRGEGYLGLYGHGSDQGAGVYGTAGQVGVVGQATDPNGGAGVKGFSAGVNGFGVLGDCNTGTGVRGQGDSGVEGSGNSTGVSGFGNTGVHGTGVTGVSGVGTESGVQGTGPVFGVFSFGRLGCSGDLVCNASMSCQNVNCSSLLCSGTKSFRIDHPFDPANKALKHYCAEGPEPMNIYSGNATLDAAGNATIDLPNYFSEINRDPRYQLTPIGAAMPLLHIAHKVEHNRFEIGGGSPGAEVSWRIEAVRNDRWVQVHGAPVELDKVGRERGKYYQPGLYGRPAEDGINYHPVPTPPKLVTTVLRNDSKHSP